MEELKVDGEGTLVELEEEKEMEGEGIETCTVVRVGPIE